MSASQVSSFGRVDPGLPAEKAGMQAGDRLVAVAGESVEGAGPRGDSVKIPGAETRSLPHCRRPQVTASSRYGAS